MFSLIASLYDNCFTTPEYNLCILGINQTGKTVLFNTIKRTNDQKSKDPQQRSSLLTYKPTVGLNGIQKLRTVCKYKHNNDKFTIWDLGGKSSIRKIWQNYYSECHGLIYMLNHNIDEGIEALKSILTHQQMARIPIAIISIEENDYNKIKDMEILKQLLTDRKVSFYLFPLDKINYMRTQILEMLHVLYLSIRELHLQIKE